MAFFSDSLASQPRHPSFAAIVKNMLKVFETVANAQNRSTDVQRMQQMTDQQLAAMGVGRDDILRYVYRDLYYI